MSYCVHCGVELDKTSTFCPLCNTKVINPSEKIDFRSPKPYPEKEGVVEHGVRRDFVILMTVCLSSTSIVCGLLNYLFLNRTAWSLYVIGACVVLWIFLLPMFFPSKIPARFSILLDGLGIMMYFGIIAYRHPGHGWYLEIALPITMLCVLLMIIFAFSTFSPMRSILFQASIFFAEMAILTVAVELLTRNYAHVPLTLSWSAIVLTCCIIIDATLITILRRSRLREEVRRRMHI